MDKEMQKSTRRSGGALLTVVKNGYGQREVLKREGYNWEKGKNWYKYEESSNVKVRDLVAIGGLVSWEEGGAEVLTDGILRTYNFRDVLREGGFKFDATRKKWVGKGSFAKERDSLARQLEMEKEEREEEKKRKFEDIYSQLETMVERKMDAVRCKIAHRSQ